jgi:hypothetical protein
LVLEAGDKFTNDRTIINLVQVGHILKNEERKRGVGCPAHEFKDQHPSMISSRFSATHRRKRLARRPPYKSPILGCRRKQDHGIEGFNVTFQDLRTIEEAGFTICTEGLTKDGLALDHKVTSEITLALKREIKSSGPGEN